MFDHKQLWQKITECFFSAIFRFRTCRPLLSVIYVQYLPVHCGKNFSHKLYTATRRHGNNARIYFLRQKFSACGFLPLFAAVTHSDKGARVWIVWNRCRWSQDCQNNTPATTENRNGRRICFFRLEIVSRPIRPGHKLAFSRIEQTKCHWNVLHVSTQLGTIQFV